MRNYVKMLFLPMALLALIACENEEEPLLEDPTAEELTSHNATIVVGGNNCDGYGIFSNKQYDCGWKRGYTDWVYHYNYAAQGISNVECAEIRYLKYDSKKKTFSSASLRVDTSPRVISTAKSIFATYYNNLVQNQNKSFFALGQFAGYSAGRGQVPYSADSDKCAEAFYKPKLKSLAGNITPDNPDGNDGISN